MIDRSRPPYASQGTGLGHGIGPVYGQEQAPMDIMEACLRS